MSTEPEKIVPDTDEAESPLRSDSVWISAFAPEHQFMLIDALGYLTDDILVKVDRASMSTSLEVRSPLLDHRLVELAWRMPLEQKIVGGKGKLPLRNALRRQVPTELSNGPRRDLVRLSTYGYAALLRDGRRSFWIRCCCGAKVTSRAGCDQGMGALSRQATWLGARIWCVLMFQSWLQAVERRMN